MIVSWFLPQMNILVMCNILYMYVKCILWQEVKHKLIMFISYAIFFLSKALWWMNKTVCKTTKKNILILRKSINIVSNNNKKIGLVSLRCSALRIFIWHFIFLIFAKKKNKRTPRVFVPLNWDQFKEFLFIFCCCIMSYSKEIKSFTIANVFLKWKILLVLFSVYRWVMLLVV